MPPTTYDVLNRSWKTATKIILGEELGELKDYEDWLGEYCPQLGRRVSSISGKEVILAVDYYSKKGNFISADERRERSIDPLGINEIKDIDSIVEAITEKWEYTGNRVLGNSAAVETADLIMDSQNIIQSTNIQRSSNIFSSFMIRTDSKHIFGSGYSDSVEFLIRVFGSINLSRCFESSLIGEGSDIYFSHNCIGCHDLLFSFFQRNKRNCIGNLQLPRERYLELKKKLLAEVVAELKRSKRFPSLFQLVPNTRQRVLPKIEFPVIHPEEDLKSIDKAFASTFRILLKKEPESITQYENWLSRHCPKIIKLISPFGNTTYLPKYSEFATFSLMPDKLLVSLVEGLELGKTQKLSEEDLSSLDKIRDRLPQIAYFTSEVQEGKNQNIISSPLIYHASNVYKTYDATYGEYVGCSSQALNSKYIFGGNRNLYSEFCINSYNSMNLSRCMEVDASSKCSDSYFCHNSESLQDCLFCFNTKGRRQAIGNTTFAPDQYAKIKASLLEQIANELLKKRTTHLDIFTIGG